jgi:hypothetical protein
MSSNRAFIESYHARLTARRHLNSPANTLTTMPTIAAPSNTSAAINELEGLAKQYRNDRDIVAERVKTLNDEIRVIYSRRLAGIKSAVAQAKDRKAKLNESVQAHQDLFVKPRTMTLHGITFGLKKGAGKITWECDDEVIIERAEKLFKDDPAALALLIANKKTLQKDALKMLDGKLLAKLGAEVEGTGDVVVIKSSDSDVDKLVARVLKEGEGEEIAPAA